MGWTMGGHALGNLGRKTAPFLGRVRKCAMACRRVTVENRQYDDEGGDVCMIGKAR